MKTILFILVVVLSFGAFAQNLLKEKITKIPPTKRGIFMDKGIIHFPSGENKSSLKAIRQFYDKGSGQERIVMDFETNGIPNVYAYISPAEKKLYLDLFGTSLNKNISSFGDSHFVKTINFFPITARSLPVEFNFKQKVAVDMFYLSSKGRIVIDVKNL